MILVKVVILKVVVSYDNTILVIVVCYDNYFCFFEVTNVRTTILIIVVSSNHSW